MSSLFQDIEKYLAAGEVEQTVTEHAEDSIAVVVALPETAARVGFAQLKAMAEDNEGRISNHEAYGYLMMVAAHCEIAARMLERLDAKMAEEN